MAYGLDHEQQFYTGLGEVLAQKRELLASQLADIGFKVLPAEVRGRCVSGCVLLDERTARHGGGVDGSRRMLVAPSP